MRRSLITVAGAGLFTVMGLLPAIAQDAPPPQAADEAPEQAPGQATAENAPEGAPERPDKSTDKRPEHRRGEHVDLRCGKTDNGNACKWSHSKHPRFAAYELWRASKDGDDATRTMVFRSSERRLTHYRDVDGPEKAMYVVRIVDAQGHMIGRSNPARVGSDPQAKPTPARPEPVLAPAGLEGPRPQPARPDRPEAAEQQRPGDRPAERPGDHRRDKVEPLDLACRGVNNDRGQGVACKWSQARHPAFAGYRLMRASRDARPAPVFHTRDRGQTMAFDQTAEPGTSYVYVIEALNAKGEVIGRSRPVRVGPHEHKPAQPEPAEEPQPDAPADALAEGVA